MRLCRYAIAACMAGVLSISGPALADDDPYGPDEEDPYLDVDADAQFKAGLEKMLRHELEEGCPQLEKSYELEPRPGTLFTLAECDAQRGRVATAVDEFRQFVKLVGGLPQVKQLKYKPRKEKADQRIAELEPSIPRLTITLPLDAPWVTEITLLMLQPDAPRKSAPKPSRIALSKLDAPLLVDPGSYVLTTQVPGGKPTETKLAIGKFEKRSVVLEVSMPAKPCAGSTSNSSTVAAAPKGGACGACAVGVRDEPSGAGVLAMLCALAGLGRRRRR
ncbi:MAG: hypothetical protein U0359_27180 [Byssovorax sp.]